MILIGSHLSLVSPNYYFGTCQKAIEYKETAFMFYTGAPQNSRRIPLERLKIQEGRQLLAKANFDKEQIVVHAPYLINLGNPKNEKGIEFAKTCLRNEMLRASKFGVFTLVLHPGAFVNCSRDEGDRSLVDALNDILNNDSTQVTICLETMAGKGSELGSSFEELSWIIHHIVKKTKIGVCLDTCHINDEGMDVANIDEVLSHFEKSIGLSYLKVIHLNDSKNPRGSHKDRHENIGYGTIGFSALEKWVKDPRLEKIPKVLETPLIVGKKPIAPYAKEIAMLVSGCYEEGWREKLAVRK